MESPLVSIIVPIYNAAMDMVPCLESIKHQRYQNLEVLLVNDGSSDASLEICRMYARLDPRVIIIDKENTGVSGTRNAAIERARGKYLQFVDSDDQLDPNATRLLVEAAEETQADLVICNYCSVMPDGKTMVHGFMQPYTRMDKAQFARCLMEEPASFYYGVMWNKLYRREIIMAHDIRCDEEFTWSEDMLFNLSYIRYADSFYAIRTPLYYYSRRRRQQKRQQGERQRIGELAAHARRSGGMRAAQGIGLHLRRERQAGEAGVNGFAKEIIVHSNPTFPAPA